MPRTAATSEPGGVEQHMSQWQGPSAGSHDVAAAGLPRHRRGRPGEGRNARNQVLDWPVSKAQHSTAVQNCHPERCRRGQWHAARTSEVRDANMLKPSTRTILTRGHQRGALRHIHLRLRSRLRHRRRRHRGVRRAARRCARLPPASPGILRQAHATSSALRGAAARILMRPCGRSLARQAMHGRRSNERTPPCHTFS